VSALVLTPARRTGRQIGFFGDESPGDLPAHTLRNGDAIRDLRNRLGLSELEASRRFGSAIAKLYELEKGEHEFDLRDAERRLRGQT
jgi:hypothetical protein